MSENEKKMKKLEDLDKKNIYSVPDGYFESLPDRIQSRIKAEKESKNTIPLYRSIGYAAAAAIVLLIAYIGIFRTSFSNQEDHYEALLDEVSTEQLVAYMEVYSEESYYEQVQLETLLEEGNIDQEKFDEIFDDEQDLLNGITEEEELLFEIDELI
jgi:hypothetical protein